MPFFSDTGHEPIRHLGGILLWYGVEMQVPSGAKRKPWNGQRIASPSTRPPTPRCAPMCGQWASASAGTPEGVRSTTTSRSKNLRRSTTPGWSSLEKHAANHPLGYGSVEYFGIEILRARRSSDLTHARRFRFYPRRAQSSNSGRSLFSVQPGRRLEPGGHAGQHLDGDGLLDDAVLRGRARIGRLKQVVEARKPDHVDVAVLGQLGLHRREV